MEYNKLLADIIYKETEMLSDGCRQRIYTSIMSIKKIDGIRARSISSAIQKDLTKHNRIEMKKKGIDLRSIIENILK